MNNKLTVLVPATAIIALIAGFFVTFTGLYDLVISASDGQILWHWTDQYLVIFLILMTVIAALGLWCGPKLAIVIVSTVLIVALGATIPVLVVLFLALSAFVTGCLILRSSEVASTDVLLLGITLFGTVLSLLVHFPVNNTGTWGILFALPLLIGWCHVRRLRSSVSAQMQTQLTPVSVHQYLLYCAISAVALLHLLVGLMPETGHDALAMHLFVPAQVAYHQSWHFNAAHYVWAVMPMFVDWLYTAGYLFAGETGARLVNIGSIFLLATLVHRLALWAGANRIGASWAVLILLSTPLIFVESSSLFIEGMWSALIVGGTLALFRLLTQGDHAKSDILLSAFLLGGALAAKAVTFTVLPVLALVMLLGVRRWFTRDVLVIFGWALLTFVVVGFIPYVTAYILTDNPVFPFFNAYFQSPLYPSVNFSAAATFERGLAWNTLYRIIFDSGKYLEAAPGAAGFQWFLLVIPGLLVLALTKQHRALLLALVGGAWLWLTFEQTAYLRYVVPTFALACALVAVVLSVAQSSGRWTYYAFTGVALIALVLNLLHFHAGTYYGKIDLNVIRDEQARDAYLQKKLPIRSAVKLVNELNLDFLNPVVFFPVSMTAGLKADGLYVSWYNPRFQKAVFATKTADDLGRLLAREGVVYLVVGDARARWHLKYHSWFTEISTEVSKIESVSVRKLHEHFRYSTELLSSTTFGQGWRLAQDVVRLPGEGIQVSNSSPATALVSVQSASKYRYVAHARCVTTPAKGRLQVNWGYADGTFAGASIKVFDCKPNVTTYSMDVRAPADVSRAVVYATAHTESPVIFTKISFLE